MNLELQRNQGQYVDVGDTCNALSMSPDDMHVAVGGRHILKIMSITAGNRFQDAAINLRTGKVNLTFSSNDVQWSPSVDRSIATAATNGNVVIWDIGRSGGSKQSRVLSDHTRAVNRISWSHHSDSLLLSGSQDGSVKLWDIRCADACVQTVNGHFGAVRDIQWSPFNANLFASGLDNGFVQVWDLRAAANLTQELAAHHGPVLAIDWHGKEPDIIASAGRDRQIKVWDLHAEDSVPRHLITTNASVARIVWRPKFPSHIASSSSLFDNRIHVWDIHSPFVPLVSCHSHDDVVTGFAWLKEGDAVVSCSKDSHIAVTSISDFRCFYEKIPMTCLDWNVDDGIAFFVNGLNREEVCERRFIPVPFRVHPDKKPRRNGAVLRFVKSNLDGPDNPLSFKQQFVFLAEHYRLTGAAFDVLCDHNSKMATLARRLDMVEVWSMLPLLFSAVQFSHALKPKKGNDVNSIFELDPLDEISMLKSLPDVKPNASVPNNDVCEGAVLDLLLRLADDGDVQNCCAVVIVLGPKFHSEPMFLRRCLVSYIELLHRHQLWTVANELIRSSPDETVACMNQSDTEVLVICTDCNEILLKGEDTCPSCRKFNTCSLCRRRVLGQFLWCQGCGHGGHPDHIREWFKTNVQCPTGCLHQCRPLQSASWVP